MMIIMMMFVSWILYSVCRLDEALEVLGRQWWYGPKNISDEVMAKYRAAAELCLDKVERTLQDQPFILGPE